ncbi:MAG: T9SS type A sorting domain-containing protein [Bacteroidetes bacterium]|nr:T9SS type A sorting domain-containing protein [Bacteroidota bacterium]
MHSAFSLILTSLDVSNNTALTYLSCEVNYLTSLDVRNGNNNNMLYFNATSTPSLKCISVDDSTWANANWSAYKDATASFSNDCALGIKESSINQISITSYNKTITIKGKGTATIYNLLGQRVHQSKLTGKTSISLDKGIYLVRVSSSGGGTSVTKKVYLR